jgi:hypothetical protein
MLIIWCHIFLTHRKTAGPCGESWPCLQNQFFFLESVYRISSPCICYWWMDRWRPIHWPSPWAVGYLSPQGPNSSHVGGSHQSISHPSAAAAAAVSAPPGAAVDGGAQPPTPSWFWWVCTGGRKMDRERRRANAAGFGFSPPFHQSINQLIILSFYFNQNK